MIDFEQRMLDATTMDELDEIEREVNAETRAAEESITDSLLLWLQSSVNLLEFETRDALRRSK